MKMIVSAVALMVLIMFAGGAFAVQSGKTLEFEGKGAGKVIFDGKVHADKGNKCGACHTKIFQMKKGTAKINMADINAGKFCGECHNGKTAFKTSDAANCAKCHKK
jgi:c(7)-type cytochrome triheme protein